MTRADLLKRLKQALKAEAFEEAREYAALLDDLDKDEQTAWKKLFPDGKRLFPD